MFKLAKTYSIFNFNFRGAGRHGTSGAAAGAGAGGWELPRLRRWVWGAAALHRRGEGQYQFIHPVTCVLACLICGQRPGTLHVTIDLVVRAAD
jgi:hypothetical protein